MNRVAAGVVVVPWIVAAAVASSAAVADQPVQVTNPGFERVAPDGSIPGWRVDPGAAPDATVGGATDVVRSGVGSLAVSSPQPGSLTVSSEPVQLEVGHLYRLSGWIRAEGLQSDPTTRYPTAVPACLTMASFPFTNHSPTVGDSGEWTRVETLFLATQGTDRVRLHVGYNGAASGRAWFDDVTLEKVEDITQLIPLETVRWFGDGYRYDDKGWIFVHVEGEPYDRGYQYGYLVADEIVDYISKLGTQRNTDDFETGWDTIRFETDTLFLRKYDREYLTEMKGIADGAAHAGAEFAGRTLDLLDVVAINSVVDLGQLHRGRRVTPHSLTGQSFIAAEDELLVNVEEHKCSAFVATGPATSDGQVVFGQIFMWGGYTGVHWNVICDLEPASGHRVVYHTFPGGIHSGSDFYINSAGIVMGETTVSQTPYEPTGTPQSNRIRKAAQYADSIDDVVDILWQDNNGMYTNDWPIADVKTGEVAILLLGTHAKKLWRTGDDMAPFGTPGFLWANNNNRDPEVRKEYVAQPDDAPYDLVFNPWNRDVAFNEFYREHRGAIDAIAGVNLWASSPINRAHACDGKITTTEMASRLVFLAHHGKVTLREKFPGESGRNMPDLPGAVPHLTLGYSVASPVFVTDKLHQARSGSVAPDGQPDPPELDLSEVEGAYAYDSRRLWRNTVYPASAAENWFVSGTAAYWHILDELAENLDDKDEIGAEEAAEHLHHQLAELNARYLYTTSREQDLAAADAARAYDRYGPYVIPRFKGTVALHQLRLLLGNETFAEVMGAVHDRFARTEMTTAQFVATAEEVSGRSLGPFVRQWIEREGLPRLQVSAEVVPNKKKGWSLRIEVEQLAQPYHLVTAVAVDAGGQRHLRRLELDGPASSAGFDFENRPTRVVFDPIHDVPVAMERFYTWRNLIDDFHHTLIVYGTSRQIEANHTLARRWQKTVADRYVEILPPLVKDSEVSDEQLASHDLVVLGQSEDNGLIARFANELPVELGKNFFRWRGTTYADPDDGLFLVVPNPRNSERVLYLVLANSAMQLHQMTKQYHTGIPSWARFEGEEIVDQGYHEVEGFVFKF